MMNRKQAVEIHEHLQSAARALAQAEAAIFDLGKEGRVAFAEGLGNVGDALHYELLQVIYDRYPDLRPPSKEIPTITSELRWDQVRLPPSTSEKGIDAIIFSAMKPWWQKVAMVVGDALQRCKQLGLPISDEALAARLQVLAERGRIEGVGDLRKWRFSEVRLNN
jgi:Protein of unknown function